MGSIALTQEYVEEAADTIFEMLSTGFTAQEIMDQMTLDREEFEKVHRRMLDKVAEQVRERPTEHVYVEYMISQIQNVKDLNVIIAKAADVKSLASAVNAIKARSDITDKILKMGQELNMIEKPDAGGATLVAGLLVANLTNKELQKTILGEISALSKLVSRHGEKNIIDLPAQPTHYKLLPGETTADVENIAGRTTKANTAKVHAGRRVVKT